MSFAIRILSDNNFRNFKYHDEIEKFKVRSDSYISCKYMLKD